MKQNKTWYWMPGHWKPMQNKPHTYLGPTVTKLSGVSSLGLHIWLVIAYSWEECPNLHMKKQVYSCRLWLMSYHLLNMTLKSISLIRTSTHTVWYWEKTCKSFQKKKNILSSGYIRNINGSFCWLGARKLVFIVDFSGTMLIFFKKNTCLGLWFNLIFPSDKNYCCYDTLNF